MTNGLNPDQDSVSPDLVPNYMKGHQQMTKIAASKEKAKGVK